MVSSEGSCSTRFVLTRTTNRSNASQYRRAADVLSETVPSWDRLRAAFEALDKFINDKKSCYDSFEEAYTRTSTSGEDWADPRLKSVLSIFRTPNGVLTFQDLRDQHSSATASDYADDIVADLKAGKLVIFDQSIGDPELNRRAAERIMWKVFRKQQRMFTSGEDLPPWERHVLVYVEEAHNLLPRGGSKDVLATVWARAAKEGGKMNLGMVLATQAPSSVLPEILSETDNWFISHLNSDNEAKVVERYLDFAALHPPDSPGVRAGLHQTSDPVLGIHRAGSVGPVSTSGCSIRAERRHRDLTLMPYPNERAGFSALEDLERRRIVEAFGDRLAQGVNLPLQPLPPFEPFPQHRPRPVVVALDGSSIYHRIPARLPATEAGLLSIAIVRIDVHRLANLARLPESRAVDPVQLRDTEDASTLQLALPGRNARSADGQLSRDWFRSVVQEVLESGHFGGETLAETLHALLEKTRDIKCPNLFCDSRPLTPPPGRMRSHGATAAAPSYFCRTPFARRRSSATNSHAATLMAAFAKPSRFCA